MGKCLIITSLKKSETILNGLFNSLRIKDLTIVRDSEEAKKALMQNNYDLVLINTPLKDESSSEFCIFVSKYTKSGIILLVKEQLLNKFYLELNKIGVVCIGKPINQNLFEQAVRIVIANNQRTVKEDEGNNSDAQLVIRAKIVLMDYLNMSECDAHHYIEKKAMDNRISKVDAAKEVLKTYE